MAIVTFFEKPGCANNTRQKALLRQAGHTVVERNLLTEAWTPATLRPFFGASPVVAWFNGAAPAVKNGDVIPERLDETQALALMCATPLLIRRPLMDVAGDKRAGFDFEQVDTWIGLAAEKPKTDLETCRKAAHGSAARCP